MAKLIGVLTAIAAVVTVISGQCTVSKSLTYHKRSIYEFSIDLMQRIAQEKENHFIASPFSAWTLIASISFGAEGKTLEEIISVLRLHHHPCFRNKIFDAINTVFDAPADAVIEKSSILYMDEQYDIKDSFIDNLSKIGTTDSVKMPFDDTAFLAAQINEYVSRGTAGKIKDMVTQDDIHGAILILVDALYFKSAWRLQFSAEETEVAPFYNENGDAEIGNVNLMAVTDKFNVTTVRQIEASVLELPYGTSNRYSMLIYLPNNKVTVSRLLSSLKRISLRTIFKMFGPRTESKTVVQIPRFQISSDMDNFKELLADMGLASMFEMSRAQFPGISDLQVYLSNLVQKATVEVNESGSEASAASVADFEFRTLPDQFIANKPFVYMIVEKSLEIPIFTGVYSKPSIY